MALTRKHGTPQALAEERVSFRRRLAASRTRRSPRSSGSARIRSALGATASPGGMDWLYDEPRPGALRLVWRATRMNDPVQNMPSRIVPW
jgi:hypothetical protein